MIRPPTPTRRLGLIADSHGSADLLKKAIDVLLLRSVDCIVHLGDFCDSQYHDQLPEIFNLLTRHRVLAVKGNNDHQVEKMIAHRELLHNRNHQKQWLTFLQKMPIIIKFDSICCCHSMPFESVRAFYDPVDTGGTDQAACIFRETEDSVIFCGHSHAPVIFRNRNGQVLREPANGQAMVTLQPHERYIIVVGAAENSECAVFDLNHCTYERIDIPASTDQG